MIQTASRSLLIQSTILLTATDRFGIFSSSWKEDKSNSSSVCCKKSQYSCWPDPQLHQGLGHAGHRTALGSSRSQAVLTQQRKTSSQRPPSNVEGKEKIGSGLHFPTGTERFQPSAPGPSRHPPRTCALPVPFPATLPAGIFPASSNTILHALFIPLAKSCGEGNYLTIVMIFCNGCTLLYWFSWAFFCCVYWEKSIFSWSIKKPKFDIYFKPKSWISKMNF